MSKLTREEFLSTLDWEGGIFDLMNYGIKASDLPDDVPKEVREAWARVYKDHEILVTYFEREYDERAK